MLPSDTKVNERVEVIDTDSEHFTETGTVILIKPSTYDTNKFIYHIRLDNNDKVYLDYGKSLRLLSNFNVGDAVVYIDNSSAYDNCEAIIKSIRVIQNIVRFSIGFNDDSFNVGNLGREQIELVRG